MQLHFLQALQKNGVPCVPGVPLPANVDTARLVGASPCGTPENVAGVPCVPITADRQELLLEWNTGTHAPNKRVPLEKMETASIGAASSTGGTPGHTWNTQKIKNLNIVGGVQVLKHLLSRFLNGYVLILIFKCCQMITDGY